MKILGSFAQIITLNHLPLKGAIKDDALEIIENGGILIGNNLILEVGNFEALVKKYPKVLVEEVANPSVLLPSFVDCHTHTCFAGSRANDFAARNAGKTYLEIAAAGGGIWSSVQKARACSEDNLYNLTLDRVNQFVKEGIKTIEIKSGYGLDLENELKMLRVIQHVKENTDANIISTCLAAHIKPKDFEGTNSDYLNWILNELLPLIEVEGLSNRVDIFIEKSAFGIEESRLYLQKVKDLGFDITVHADQFTAGSATLAAELGALSADHLEASTEKEIEVLANSATVAVVLPGASIGLGEPFAPARKLLDAGACLAIASDYNPGSAPMGDLLTQASILATYQKLSTAEALAGLTFRAAKALNINNIGKIAPNYKADLQVYACDDYREILYHQGRLKPYKIV